MSEQKINLYKYEGKLIDDGVELIAGVDEVGRGPIAGPLVVSAVILPTYERIEGINDSKKLSEKKRLELYKIIMKKAIAINTVFVYENEIDESDIYRCTQKAMRDAVMGLKVEPGHVLIDAMPLPGLEIPHTSIIHGDAQSASIGAASIIAKVTRDEYMKKMDIKYPNYGFARHKGYCTKEHVEALYKNGPCKIHRKSFAPVSHFYSKQLSIFDLNNEE